MKLLTRLGVLLLTSEFANFPALATIPGNLEERAVDGLLHVCIDNEPGDPKYIVCDETEQVEDQPVYTGSECAAAGLTASCTIDFVPKARVHGELLLTVDDTTLDAFGDPAGPGSVVELVFKLKGEKQLLVEVLATDTIGNWNPADEPIDSIEFTNADRSAFPFANGNLSALGDELRELADAAFKADLTGTVPVLTDIYRLEGKLESDHSEDELASATRWRVVIEFARVRP
jgi:hypothetical protein